VSIGSFNWVCVSIGSVCQLDLCVNKICVLIGSFKLDLCVNWICESTGSVL